MFHAFHSSASSEKEKKKRNLISTENIRYGRAYLKREDHTSNEIQVIDKEHCWKVRKLKETTDIGQVYKVS